MADLGEYIDALELAKQIATAGLLSDSEDSSVVCIQVDDEGQETKTTTKHRGRRTPRPPIPPPVP